MNTTIKTILASTTFFISGLALAQPVPPMPPSPPPVYGQMGRFDQEHPRVAELNRRLDFESHKLRESVDSGMLDPYRARMIGQQIHAVKENIRNTFRRNGGYITDEQFRGFNAQENQIRNELQIRF